MLPYQFSRCYETQRIFRQKCDVTFPPRHPMHDNFRHQKFFEIQICSPTRFIVSVKKKFNGEWWNPLLMHKIVYTGNFLKYRRVTLRILSALRVTKKIEKTRDAPPQCYARKFSIRDFSWIRERLSYDFLRHYETKNFRRKIAIPPYFAWIFFDTRKVLKFWKTEVFPNVFFTTVKESFLTKPWCPPRPIHDSFLLQFSLKHRCLPLRFFLALWDYLFSTENWDTLTTAPSSSLNFSLPETFWKTQGFFYENFRSWETKTFRQTRYTPHSHAW